MSLADKKVITYNGSLLTYDSILRIEEKNEDTFIFLADGKFEKSVLSIDILEWDLPKNIFTRVHAKHLVNKHFIKNSFTQHINWLELENGEKIPTSNNLKGQNKTKFISKSYIKIIRKLKKAFSKI